MLNVARHKPLQFEYQFKLQKTTGNITHYCTRS